MDGHHALINELFMRGDRRGPAPEIPGLKTRNPEIPGLKIRNPEVPKSEKRIPGSRKGQSRNPELKNTRSRSPDKGPIPPHLYFNIVSRNSVSIYMFLLVLIRARTLFIIN